jgi:2-iminobutanoate/2-iminopropanoate deaminase
MSTARIAGLTPHAPAPAGPYSQAVRIGSIISCAGQAGLTPAGELVDGVAGQTRQALDNLAAALASCDASLDDVAHVRVYLTDPAQFAEMNEVYAATFSEPYPARTTVYVTLPAGLLVEIDVMAVKEDAR